MNSATFPRMFGKYALLRPFARGGMGEICLAAHGELGGLEKLCLVKKVLEADDQPSLAARLLDEAKIAVRLNHANLVQVFDAGKVDEELYIAMELIEGRDLRAVWNRTAERRSRIPLDVALYIVREMARGLDYAHNYGGLNLVHRDIAPPNILLSWHGEVKITDFGLARSILKSEKTAPGIVYGRIAYLAPEQARGEQADKRTDLYAVGVILWELLTGRPLHETTDEAVKNLEMARHPRFESPSHLARGIAASLDAVVLKALAPRRDDRYQTADELRRALSEELAHVAPTTDASRLASWLSELFDEEVKTEGLERERILREELPILRERSTFQAAALASRAAAPRAKSLDLRIAGVDRQLDTDRDVEDPTDASEAVAALPGARRSQLLITPPNMPVQKPPTAAVPKPSEAMRSTPQRRSQALAFDDEGETRVQDQRGRADRLPSRAQAAVAAAPKPRPTPDPGVDDTLSPETLVGEIVDGRYRVERLLGTGGMGAVYEAEHIEIGKKVALKVLHPQFSRQADLVQRFRREARAASKVGHPNIVDVTDSGTTEQGDAYFVMERLDGTDLADVLRNEHHVAVDRTVGIGAQICRALQAAHQAGIIHRDLKPENIFLVARDGQPDFVKVLDFGIAKSDGGSAQAPRRLTTPGIAMGTPEYMAPEQAAGKPVDGRVDIYSVGAILYEMLVGEPPHAGPNIMDILAKKATEEAAPLRPRNKNVPEALERTVLACLEREPERRPQTMAQLEYELNKCGKGRGSAVAAVLGIKAPDEAAWDEPSRTSQFEGGVFGGPTQVNAPRGAGVTPPPPGASGQLVTASGLGNLVDETVGDGNENLVTPPQLGIEQDLARPTTAMPPVRASSGWSRLVSLLAGLAFLGGAGYLAYTRVGLGGAATTRPKTTGKAAPRDPVATGDPKTARVPKEPVDDTAGTPVAPKPLEPADDEPSDAEIARLLEWAKQAAGGGRIVAPPGDNLKELLDRIEKASPGNSAAAELRTKTSTLLGRRGTLALKKMRLEEAEDAFRALVVLRPDDDWSKSRLARTLALRGDRSLDRKRYQAALNDANHALELAPDDVLARMVLGEVHLATGKRELAVEEFKRVIELRPADKRAHRGLAAAMTPPPKKPTKPGKPTKKNR